MINASDILDIDGAIPDIPKEEYIILQPGVYHYRVASFTRGDYKQGHKNYGAKFVEIVVTCIDDEGNEATAKTKIPMLKSSAWKFRDLFLSAGFAVEQGKPFHPDWNLLPGSSGRCSVEPYTFTGNDGQQISMNTIKKFLPPVDDASSSEPGF